MEENKENISPMDEAVSSSAAAACASDANSTIDELRATSLADPDAPSDYTERMGTFAAARANQGSTDPWLEASFQRFQQLAGGELEMTKMLLFSADRATNLSTNAYLSVHKGELQRECAGVEGFDPPVHSPLCKRDIQPHMLFDGVHYQFGHLKDARRFGDPTTVLYSASKTMKPEDFIEVLDSGRYLCTLCHMMESKHHGRGTKEEKEKAQARQLEQVEKKWEKIRADASASAARKEEKKMQEEAIHMQNAQAIAAWNSAIQQKR